MDTISLIHFPKWMGESGLTDEELSVLFGVTTRTIRNWRRCRVVPKLETVMVNAKAFAALRDDLAARHALTASTKVNAA